MQLNIACADLSWADATRWDMQKHFSNSCWREQIVVRDPLAKGCFVHESGTQSRSRRIFGDVR